MAEIKIPTADDNAVTLDIEDGRIYLCTPLGYGTAYISAASARTMACELIKLATELETQK